MGTTGQSITLANSIIGVGILAMPFCFQQCGVLLATLILISMGLVSRLCCHFLLKSAILARRRNFEFLAFHVFGSAGKMAVEVGIIGFLMGTCIAYFVVVGDLGPQIIAKMFNINQSDILRTSIMVIVSLVCVLPLGLLRNVDSLSNVSAATIGFYFCLVLKVIAEAASQLLSGDWHTRVEMWKPSGVLQCVPIFSMALFCQTQLFEIFESLPSLSLEKMNVVAKNAINICTSVYFTLGIFGYIAFNSQKISGNILMSLSPTMASDVIKLGFVMSLAFSFPLIIFPCRASLYSFLYKKVHSSHHDHIINNSIPESSFRCITVAIIAVALFISLLLPNIELVLGLVGSTIGVLVCVIFPTACFINITFKNTNERILAKAVLVLGLVIMVLGTYANLQAAETSLDKYDDKITQERIDKIVEDFFEKMEKPEGKVEVILENKDKEEADSEIQPPNPVPPESQSNEKKSIISPDKVEDKHVVKETKIAEDTAYKASESHPRNLKTKLLNEAKIGNQESNLSNGKSINVEEIVENKVIEPKEEQAKQQLTQEKVQQKLDMLKKQQLIETIKQHDVEQKELIKEQKEILNELKKTNNELQQNKKEVDRDEVKKIAVESIKKIADMAIQSLSGVNDKLAAQENQKKSEPLENVANEALHEIANKAVETIEAIKEIKESPKEPAKPHQPELISNNIVQQVNNIANPIPQQNNVPKQEVNANIANANIANVPHQNNAPVVNQLPIQNNVVTNQKIEAVQQNLNPNINVIPAAHVNQQAKVNQVPSNPSVNIVNPNAQPLVQSPNVAVKPQDNIAPNVIPAAEINNKPVQNANPVNQPILNQGVEVHSHSPDEPQSYKRGEDLQEKTVNEHLNVPLLIAMNGNSQKVEQNNIAKPEPVNNIAKAEVPAKTVDVANSNINMQANVQNNGAKETAANVVDNKLEAAKTAAAANMPVRQKREVVYCRDKMLLKPEDRVICKTLIGSQENKLTHNLLPKVDLNDVILPKSLPMDTMVHHMRSLKSYDENEKKR